MAKKHNGRANRQRCRRRLLAKKDIWKPPYDSPKAEKSGPRNFPQFGQLPQELQDRIWDMAMQQDHELEPQIHFFSNTYPDKVTVWDRRVTKGYNDDSDDASEVDHEHKKGRETGQTLDIHSIAVPGSEPVLRWESPGYDYIAPRQWSDAQERKSDYNEDADPSGYTMSWRPWHACRDAMKAMKRNLRWGELRALEDHKARRTLAIGFRDDLPSQPMIINPCRDLIAFKSPSEPRGWTEGQIATPIWGTTIFADIVIGAVALDFLPQWAHVLDEYDEGEHGSPGDVIWSHRHGSIQGLISQLQTLGDKYHWRGDKASQPTIWFLDYDFFQPKKGIPYSELSRGRTVFRGKGQRYVQVHGEDIGVRWMRAPGKRYRDTAVGFCHRLWGRLVEEFEFDKISYDTGKSCAGDSFHRLRWEVAACIPDSFAEEAGAGSLRTQEQTSRGQVATETLSQCL